jgi:hypothetical protein
MRLPDTEEVDDYVSIQGVFRLATCIGLFFDLGDKRLFVAHSCVEPPHNSSGRTHQQLCE